ncbi:hypothetical protein EV122DRAFT_260478 [Schizophyllum commune]
MKSKRSARKATWLAFGLVVMSALTVTAVDTTSIPDAVESAVPKDSQHTTAHAVPRAQTDADSSVQSIQDQNVEATRAYKYAMTVLNMLTAHQAQPTLDPLAAHRNTHSRSILSSFVPDINGPGPLASAMRILARLQNLFPSFTGASNMGYFSTATRREYDLSVKVMDLLQHSADLGNMDALYMIAQLSLFPPTELFPLDPSLAYRTFSKHAAETGNATSQSMIAFFHATGYHDVVPIDQAKAQLYYTFAANGGDKGAQMALAYRYWSGIGTVEDCQRAVVWYESASEQAMAKYRAGPPGGRTLPQTPTRLSDLVGGVYGPGASVASTGLNAQRPAIKAGIARAAGETWADVLEYYLFNADRGETDFAYRLGKIFYQGSIYVSPGGIASGSEGVGAVPRDYERARYYFLLIARQVWPRDPPNPLHPSANQMKEEGGPVGYAAAAAGYLGRMYLRGEGVKPDMALAKMWFQRGADHGDRECHNGLGIMFRDGLVPNAKADMKKALSHFAVAAGQELAEAQVHIGKYHFERGELASATTYFEAAIRHGSPFEAYYYLGEIHSAQAATPGLPPHVTSSSCAMAVSFHKLVSERGVWEDDLLREAEIAWMSGTEKGQEVAMLKWWIAAERGSEIAQNNLAYVLDQDRSVLRLTRFSPIIPSNDTARLALTQWTRAAAQRNIDALVKVGDYYYHGLGVPEESEQTRYEKAARYYQSAADTQISALAMWNLGWMYENGIGVPQDFHLAKRHYDLALETNSEAYVPVLLSLIRLYARSMWHTLQGGKGGLNLWEWEDEGQDDVLSGQIPPQVEDGREPPKEPKETPLSRDEERYYEDGGPWYMGKAREDFRRRKSGEPRGPREDEDPIQWARDRRAAEQDRDGDFGPEDSFEGTMRLRADAKEDDDADDMILVIALVALITVLLYVRSRIYDQQRRQAGQDDAAPQNGGRFPPPGDPARNEWNILR